MRASDLMIETLINNEITTFFGIPGGPIASLFDSVLKNKDATLIESRQESSAIFSAIGFYRETGKIPCVLVTAGPGLTNCITGLTTAFLENIPLILICGDVSSNSGKQLLQDCGPDGINAESILKSITCRSFRITNTNSTIPLTFASILEAKKNKQPAVLIAPTNISNSEANKLEILSLDYNNFSHITNLIKEAQRPLIIIGGACHACPEITNKIIKHIKFPFTTTPRAKGIISEKHPFSLKNCGIAASNWIKEYLKEEIDLMIIIGTDFDDCSMGSLDFSNVKQIIHIDKNPSVFNKNIKTDIGVVSTIENFYNFIWKDFVFHNKNNQLVEIIKKIKRKKYYNKITKSKKIHPAEAILALQKATNKNTKFVTDIGEHMLFALHYLTSTGPDKFLINIGLGSMGSGIGSAIGKALGSNGELVVCICGDGCMQMAGMEVLVAKKYKLPIIFAVFNDGRYNMVYHGYKHIFNNEHPWNTPNISFKTWANSMGILSKTITKKEELNKTLINKLTKNKEPVILDIKIDESIKFAGGGRNEMLKNMSMEELMQ